MAMCIVQKSTNICFLDFWLAYNRLLCSCTLCATVFSDMQRILYSSAWSAHLATAATAAFLALRLYGSRIWALLLDFKEQNYTAA